MKRISLVLLFSVSITASAVAENLPHLIAVQGESKVELEPNRVILSLEVKQTRKTLDEARQGVGASLKTLVIVLNKYGITDKQIEKTQIWQGPDYQWENNKQVLKGYSAMVQLKATLDDLEQLAKLADALADISDTTLRNTGFTRSDIERQQAEQRKLALLNARQKAIDMLAVYNETLGPVLMIRDAGASEPPVLYDSRLMKGGRMEAFSASQEPEPASWQKVTISANVQVEFGIQ